LNLWIAHVPARDFNRAVHRAKLRGLFAPEK
jgi:hypothetical protein